jgi:CRISPR system Cascade subunit CasE
MYLTRFEINSARRDTRRMLSSLQAMHAAVLASFPSSDANQGRILWRTDNSDTALWLYICSPAKPDLTHLVEQIGWPSRLTWQTSDYSPLLENLTTGQRWGFRLTANPARSGKATPQATKTQRFGHVSASQQQQWLIDRAERCGFALATTSAGETDLIIHNRAVHRFQRGGATVTLSAATYDGSLEVIDPGALRSALTGGIGPAKAYGCGLMTLVKNEA